MKIHYRSEQKWNDFCIITASDNGEAWIFVFQGIMFPIDQGAEVSRENFQRQKARRQKALKNENLFLKFTKNNNVGFLQFSQKPNRLQMSCVI